MPLNEDIALNKIRPEDITDTINKTCVNLNKLDMYTDGINV